MNPFLAYFLGLFTIIFILVIFWILATLNPEINQVYKGSICNSIF